MTQSQNQFAQTAEKGTVDLDGLPTNVLSCQVSFSELSDIVDGQAIKIEDSAGGVPKVLALDALTDNIDGYVVKTQKQSTYVAGDRLQVAIDGTVMVMEANGAIARRGEVEVAGLGTTAKVAPALGTNTKGGIALDKASADGDLIRVYIRSLQLT